MLAHDAYDLVFTLLNHEGDAEAAGRAAAASSVAGHPQVTDALALPEERFSRCRPPNEYRPLFQDRTYVDVISRRFIPDTRRQTRSKAMYISRSPGTGLSWTHRGD